MCHEFALPIATASPASGRDENRGGMREVVTLLGGLRVRLRLAGFLGVIHLLDARGFGERSHGRSLLLPSGVLNGGVAAS